MPKETFFNLPEEKRQALVNIALDEFSENDYRNVSISRFVKRAGIAKGSFYQYFEDKKDLYLYLIELAGREKGEFFAQHPPPDPEMGVFAYLRWMYTIGVKFEFRQPQFAAIGYRALYGDAPLPAETIQVLSDGTLGFFRQLVEQGRQQGHIRPDIDPDLAAFMFNAVFTNLGDYMMKRLDITPEALVENLGSLESPEGQQLFNGVVDLLEAGMGTQ